MVSKTEKLYLEVLPLKVVTFEEIVDKARNIMASKDPEYIYRKYVRKLVQEGKLQRVRRGLYAVLFPLEEPRKHIPDKFLIGSKIRDGYYLGYHTALEFYGSAYSRYNEVYVCVKNKDRFDPFQYRGLKFRPVFVKDTDLGVEKKKYLGRGIRVSSKERTFIDSLHRVQYAGGWEECLKSLQGMGGLNFNNTYKYLLKYDNELLFRKVGFVLELLRNTSVFYEHIDDNMLSKLQDNIGENPRYLTEGGPVTFNKKWLLYVPEKFEEKLRGV